MEGSLPASPIESPPCEALFRSKEGTPYKISLLKTLESRLEAPDANVLARLVTIFSIPDSAIGLATLAHELRLDLATLSKTQAAPSWVGNLQALLRSVTEMVDTEVARDRASLRSQPKCPLRDFLAPVKTGLEPTHHRALRAVRATVALRLISSRERLTTTLATELSRWLLGRVTVINELEEMTLARLQAKRKDLPQNAAPAKLLTLIIEAQEAPLPTPFVVSINAPLVAIPVSPLVSARSQQDGTETTPANSADAPDPLRSLKAAKANAGCRIFAGVPDLWRYLQPFELEAVVPRILEGWRRGQADVALASLITLFIRVAPSAFPRIPLAVGEGAGLWLDPELGCIGWNLDELVASHTAENHFVRTANDRYVLIPLPIEVATELLRRMRARPLASTIADLFEDADGLHKRAKAFLRELTLTSHRPSLTRLAASWGRYVLSHCADEGYAAAIGIDFTLGTSANFNYLLLRGRRIQAVLRACYAAIGLSGRCADTEIADVGSMRLPLSTDAERFIRKALSDINDAIVGLPRNCGRERLLATHNQVAGSFYALFRFVTGGRSLAEETVARSRIHPASGIVLLIDKRVSAYHACRPCLLPPTARGWLTTYLSWLLLVAYRLGALAPTLAKAIHCVAEGRELPDRHPLFFRFRLRDGATEPLGTSDIAPILTMFSLEPNAGRHLLDALFRHANVDSTAIMAWMGRGNPGQEAYGSGSAAVPARTLAQCASATENWLRGLALPPPVNLSPRTLETTTDRARQSIYVPNLLTTTPPSVSMAGGEHCPFSADTVAMSGIFAELYHAWRSTAPPPSWSAFALSLILEDGVCLAEELEAALKSSEHRVLYHHDEIAFLDTRCAALGLRRIWLSAVSVRLLGRIPASQARFSGLQSIAAAARELIGAARGPETNEAVQFVLNCARAYFALNTPGLLFAWMNGTTFSRTARPAVIARTLLGRCEHPAFDVRERMRRRRAADEMSKKLRAACNAVSAGRSHQTALLALAESLTEMDALSDPDAPDHLTVGYCLYLATTQQNVFTVERYMSACRPFLADIAASTGDGGLQNADWHSLISKGLRNGNDGDANSPTAAAINHCLTWLGIDVRLGRRSGPPPSAFTYADRLTDREIDGALFMLESQRKRPGDDVHRAEVALRLMFDHPLRWDEVASIRLCDLALSTEVPHLAITDESGADLKTRNAPRVLRLNSRKTIDALAVLHAVRLAQYPSDLKVPLFGDDDRRRVTDSRHDKTSQRIHDLISETLWRSTGSVFITPHNCRHTVITRELHAILDTSRHDSATPLQLRQAPFSLSARAGHGHHDVTIGDYAEDLDWARRKWMDALQTSLACRPTPTFLNGITGVRASTYRKRASRTSEPVTHDLWEGFDSAHLKHIGCVRALATLVDSSFSQLESTNEQAQADRLTAAGCYIGLRILGEDEETAAFAARLTVPESTQLERSLSRLLRSSVADFATCSGVCRDRFVKAMFSSRLPVALAALTPSPDALRASTRAVRKMNATWEFADYASAVEFAPLAQPIRAAGVVATVLLRTSSRSAIDAFRISEFADVGLPHVRLLTPRHFHRNVECMVRFTSVHEDSGVASRASAQHTFLVSTSIVAIYLLKELPNGHTDSP